jgi:hypothetical protein
MAAIRIDIASEFKDKGFKNAQKSTDKLNRSFVNLQRTALKTFVAVAGIRALRNSVRAFADEDKAVKNLTQSLKNLGLGYNVGAIENYISATQAATGVSDDQLRPAMVELVQVTLDAQKATELLNTAMDLSAGTGSGLNASVKALTRAYNGNYTSLGKLQRVYTTAELEAMGFQNAVVALNETFGGTAAANADSYGGKIDRLNIAVDEARETIGKGLVDAFETLADGDFDKVIDAIASSAKLLSGFMRNIAFSIQYTKALLKTGWTIGQDEQAQLDMIRRQWMDPADNSNTAAANRVFLRDMKSQLAIQKKIAAERAKTAKLAEKEKKNQEALSKAKAIFDLQKIQIEAALRGKITEEERTRLLLMKAILEEDADTATALMTRLKEMQTETMKLAYMLTNFPKANDPFQDWFKTLERLQQELAKILSMTLPQTLAAKTSASAGNAALALGDAYAAQGTGLSASADAILAIDAANAAIAGATTPEELAAAEDFLAGANAALDAANAILESAAALTLAAAGAEMLASADVLGESVFGALQSGVPMTEINVIVEGSVISAEDLAETITDIQYNYQRAGKDLRFSSIAI